jgi:hypothetical protein
VRVVERRYIAAGAAFAAAGAVAVAPVAPQTPKVAVASPATQLLAGEDSLLNVPTTLLDDIANIPYYEVHDGLDTLARSLMFTGTWWVPSSTNLWGTDPGDPGHFEAVSRMLFPFPELSHPLGDQLAGNAAAELPISSDCAAGDCLPVDPSSPITGMTLLDGLIWPPLIATGLQKFPLVDNWNQVPQAELANGYTFDPDNDGSTNPAGEAHAGFGFPGTYSDGDHDNLMPWVGDGGDDNDYGFSGTFHSDMTQPFQHFADSLTDAPSTDGVLGSGIEMLDPVDLARTLQAVLAGLVIDFDPFTPGSPLCLGGDCSLVTNLHLDYPDLVKDINNLWPGNDYIEQWLAAYDDGDGDYNGPTDDQIQHSYDSLHQGLWDFGNPSPPDDQSVLFNPGDLAPLFHDLYSALGLNPPDFAEPVSAAADGSGEPVGAATDAGTGSADGSDVGADLANWF